MWVGGGFSVGVCVMGGRSLEVCVMRGGGVRREVCGVVERDLVLKSWFV